MACTAELPPCHQVGIKHPLLCYAVLTGTDVRMLPVLIFIYLFLAFSELMHQELASGSWQFGSTHWQPSCYHSSSCKDGNAVL